MEVLDQSLSLPKVNKTWAYEGKMNFQVSRAIKLPWAKLQLGAHCEMQNFLGG
jgi:hypothetical protein